MRAPSPLRMKSGVPPTALNARTGELTPPGMRRRARANSCSDWVMAGSGRPAHEVLGVVGEDHVGPRAGDGGERLLHDARLVDPAPGRRRLHHRVLPGDVVRGHGDVERL